MEDFKRENYHEAEFRRLTRTATPEPVKKTYEVRETVTLIHTVKAASAAQAARAIVGNKAHDIQPQASVLVDEINDDGGERTYLQAKPTRVRRWA